MYKFLKIYENDNYSITYYSKTEIHPYISINMGTVKIHFGIVF